MRSFHILFNSSATLSDAWTWLDTGNSSSWKGGSGCSTSTDPLAGPDGCELEDGRAVDDSSSHILFISSARLGGARSGLGTDCSLEIDDGSGWWSSVCPSASPNGCELDDGCVADDSSGFTEYPGLTKWPSASEKISSNSPARFRVPNMVVACLGMCTTSTRA
ncbi:hypothetical protein BGY98DRAFT_985664 [Russula aff. rugulosa BPL654]|nr:hypothetical protein BGY98DRAFT_985664 [Russula aff. rugulosa BPL654]